MTNTHPILRSYLFWSVLEDAEKDFIRHIEGTDVPSVEENEQETSGVEE